MSKLRLTVACGDYDIVKALKEGTVEAGDLELIFLTDMGPRRTALAAGPQDGVRRLRGGCMEPVAWRAVAAIRSLRCQSSCPPLPARLSVVNAQCGHPVAQGPDRPPSQRLSTSSRPATSGCAPWKSDTAFHTGKITWIVDRSRTFRSAQPPGFAHRDEDVGPSLGDMLADGDLPAMISPTIPRPLRDGGQADRCACSRTTSRSRWSASRSTGISRSCT